MARSCLVWLAPSICKYKKNEIYVLGVLPRDTRPEQSPQLLTPFPPSSAGSKELHGWRELGQGKGLFEVQVRHIFHAVEAMIFNRSHLQISLFLRREL